MSFFSKLSKAIVSTAILPIDVARDVLLAVPTGETKTIERIKSIYETLEEAVEEIDKED